MPDIPNDIHKYIRNGWIDRWTYDSIAKDGRIDIVKYLVETHPDLYINKPRSTYIMERAAGYGNVEIVEFMIEKGAGYFQNALMYAASGGHMNVIKLMIDKCDLHSEDFWTIAEFAAQYGHIDIITMLIDMNIDGFNTANHFNLIMYYAASGGHIDIVNLTIEKGVLQTVDLDWIIKSATANNHMDIVKLLENYTYKN